MKAVLGETMRARLRWWAAAPLLPTLAVQGTLVRRRIPLLPEAAGPRSGVVGSGGPELAVAVIGESTAAGVGVDSQDDALGARLALALAASRGGRVRWQVAGRTGLTIAKARRELLPELHGAPEIVVVVFGVNDVLKLTSERTWRCEVDALLRALLARGAHHVLFAAAPPLETFSVLPYPLRSVLGVRARFLNALLADVVRARGDASLVQLAGIDPALHLAADGFHPSALGYALWAELLADRLCAPSR